MIKFILLMIKINFFFFKYKIYHDFKNIINFYLFDKYHKFDNKFFILYM